MGLPKMAILALAAWSESTAPQPTSLPVPAVVGTAMRGSASVTGLPRSSSRPVQSMAAAAAAALAQSMAEPPPRPMMARAPSSLARRAQASTLSQVGLGSTSEMMSSTRPPAHSFSRAATPLRWVKGSETISARSSPRSAISCPSSSSFPVPKTTSTGL